MVLFFCQDCQDVANFREHVIFCRYVISALLFIPGNRVFLCYFLSYYILQSSLSKMISLPATPVIICSVYKSRKESALFGILL